MSDTGSKGLSQPNAVYQARCAELAEQYRQASADAAAKRDAAIAAAWRTFEVDSATAGRAFDAGKSALQDAYCHDLWVMDPVETPAEPSDRVAGPRSR